MTARARRNNLLRFSSVPPTILAITLGASWLGMVATIILGYPLAIIGIVTILPWLPVLFTEALWKYRHYAWFALFEMLLVAQTLHMCEHIAQVVEVDVIGWPRLQARGIIGTLDVEYVHFFFDTFLLIGTSALLFGRFRRNIPLWVAWVIAIWHTTEHWYITYFYTFDYANYDPNNPRGLHAQEGLLGQNGLLWSGSPFPRIELHFLYNLFYTIPLLWAFILVLRGAYDEYLKRTFPHLSEAELISLSGNLEALQVNAGEIITRQGEPADRFYIISRGEVEVLQEAGDQAVVINTLTSGQCFGETGLLNWAPRRASVRARTHCDLLALDREAFKMFISNAPPVPQASVPLLAPPNGLPVPAGVPGSVAYPASFPAAGPQPAVPAQPTTTQAPTGPALALASAAPAPTEPLPSAPNGDLDATLIQPGRHRSAWSQSER